MLLIRWLSRGAMRSHWTRIAVKLRMTAAEMEAVAALGEYLDYPIEFVPPTKALSAPEKRGTDETLPEPTSTRRNHSAASMPVRGAIPPLRRSEPGNIRTGSNI